MGLLESAGFAFLEAAALEKSLNSRLSFQQAALIFCLPKATSFVLVSDFIRR